MDIKDNKFNIGKIFNVCDGALRRQNKWLKLARAQQPKTVCLHVNKPTSISTTSTMDQCAIQKMYKWYTKRLHDCRRAEGQMTRY